MQDAAWTDLGALFARDGLFDRFWQAQLEPCVDTSTRPWRSKGRLALDFAPGFLAFFERVHTVRTAFFDRDPRDRYRASIV